MKQSFSYFIIAIVTYMSAFEHFIDSPLFCMYYLKPTVFYLRINLR